MPCSPRKARILLKNGKAKVVRRTPFTIKLLHGSSGHKQEVVGGMDTGSSFIGVAAVSNKKILFKQCIQLRQDISKKLKARREYRRNRRNRKTRYRPARWRNRKRSEGWLTPTLRSKVDNHLKAKSFLEKILPIISWNIETAAFDIHKINNPDVSGRGYQNGPLKDFANVKKYVLERDGYSCTKCKAKKVSLHVHHVVFRRHGGGDNHENLVTLCQKCHERLHAGDFGNPEKMSLVLAKNYFRKKKVTRGATHISTICAYLKKGLEFKETFGYETKYYRERLGLQKSHENDALVIALGLFRGREVVSVEDDCVVHRAKCVSKGDYAQTRGRHSRERINTGKIGGFRRYDKVEYGGDVAFIKGRMTSGYAVLMDIGGNSLKLKPIPKFSRMRRLSARKTWITILAMG